MKIHGYIYAILAAVTWGLVYNIDQRILTQLSPMNLLLIDAVLTLVVLLPIFIFHRSSFHDFASINKRELFLIIASLVLAIIANFFIYSGIHILGAETASVFEIMYPFFVVAFGFLLFREELNWSFAAGGLLIFIGAFIISKFG